MVAYENIEAYETYRAATQIILDAQEAKKVLYKQMGNAADSAKYATRGTVQDKVSAALAAMKPYQEKIAALNTEIDKNYEIADHNFDVWKGLK